MGALENERRQTFQEWEVKAMIREHLQLPDDAEMIWQTDGGLLVVWDETRRR